MDKNDFLGVGWSFPPSFPKGKNSVSVTMVSDEDDIKESLEILLSTQVGERIMHRHFGTDLNSLIFKPMNIYEQIRIKDLIFDSIYQYEPRIKPEDVVFTDLTSEGKILLDISYVIRATNMHHNIVFPYYLEEGTLI